MTSESDDCPRLAEAVGSMTGVVGKIFHPDPGDDEIVASVLPVNFVMVAGVKQHVVLIPVNKK